jgi:hypothetical protein
MPRGIIKQWWKEGRVAQEKSVNDLELVLGSLEPYRWN